MSPPRETFLAVSRRRRIEHGLTRWASFTLAGISVGFLGLMIALFVWTSLPVWRHEGLGYVGGSRWFYRAGEFGAAPMIYGTSVVALVSLIVAGPLGIGAALFTAEVLEGRSRIAAKATIELLAGIPSVVYGLLGVLFLRNWVYRLLAPFEPLSGDTLLTAGLLLGVMVLPTVMTLSDDALRGVPRSQRLAARGLGMTRAEAIFAVSLPQAAPGILAAMLLGFGRALGETIAVFLVVGRQDNQLPASLFSLEPLIGAGQTLTSKLGGSETNLAYGDPLHWAAIVGLGVLLLGLVVIVTLAGAWLAEGGFRSHA